MKLILNINTGLDLVENDKELYKDLLGIYLSDTVFDQNTICNLINSGKTEDAANYIHRIKGASGQIGAEQLFETAYIAERILRGKEHGNIRELIPLIEQEFAATRKAVQEYLNS